MEQVTVHPDVNKDHDPSPHEERILRTLKAGRDAGEPWGYATPSRVAAREDVPRQRVSEAMSRLEAAGWVRQVEENETLVRGLYRFVGDPREDTDA
jgi:DNA-binding MarR family transcriptional regulator